MITLRPKHPEARRLLALAHCTLGEIDKAIRIFEEWLEDEPGDPIALHMLAACTGRDTPARASDGYVQQSFDSFAASFESKLAKLAYRAPTLVSAMLDDAGLEASRRLDVLDAGCGTGLCGPLIAPYARRLTGVDLSAGMLAQAKEKNIYDELLQTELTEYLRGQTEAFDVIVSADTLVYFGGLEEVVAAAAGALRPGGLLIFTLEHDLDESAPDHRLQTHGRYAHARPYVERVLGDCGFAVTSARLSFAWNRACRCRAWSCAHERPRRLVDNAAVHRRSGYSVLGRAEASHGVRVKSRASLERPFVETEGCHA